MAIGPLLTSINKPSPTPLVSIVYAYNESNYFYIFLYDYDPYTLTISKVIISTRTEIIEYQIYKCDTNSSVSNGTIFVICLKESPSHPIEVTLHKGLNLLNITLSDSQTLVSGEKVIYTIFFTNGWSINGVYSVP